MLTLGAFMCLVWVSCIYALAHRYRVKPVWTTTVSLFVAMLTAVVVGMAEGYEPLWYIVSLNVVLLGALMFVFCLGNAEKLEWTTHLGEVTDSIHDQLLRNQESLNELHKRIK